MARRKTPRAARGRQAAKRGAARPARTRAAAARKKSAARKARPARARKNAAVRGASAKQTRARKAPASRVQRKTAAPARTKKSSVRRASKGARKAPAAAARKTAGARTAPPRTPARTPPFVARKAPSLDRERRTVRDDDIVPTPPSSLDLDRSASAARTGRRELHERFVEHTETSPAITGGDIDADWESAYTVGDEAPGGDNPTPDQDIVDDIGRAVGVEYEDNEELKGETKITERDRKRWELDPASSEDYNDR